MVYDAPYGTNVREFQIERMEDAQDIYKPQVVLEVGHPGDYQELLDGIWGCDVESVDPHLEQATHKVKFEDFEPTKRYDLVHMGSVLDYLDDPVGCLHKARDCGNAILLQCRLNTYVSPYFKPNYWTPTRKWVEERAAIELGLVEVNWMDFQGTQFFSICGRTR